MKNHMKKAVKTVSYLMTIAALFVFGAMQVMAEGLGGSADAGTGGLGTVARIAGYARNIMTVAAVIALAVFFLWGRFKGNKNNTGTGEVEDDDEDDEE